MIGGSSPCRGEDNRRVIIMETATILIVDDDRTVCAALQLLLRRAGYRAEAVHLPREVAESVRRLRPDLLLLDMNFTIETSGRKGLELLRSLRADFPDLPVILMTGWATVQLAVEGMKAGARDFIAKPWDNRQMLASVETILALQRPAEGPTVPMPGFGGLIGRDPAFRALLATAQRVAATDAAVLITGESGTGKEMVAEAIHYESRRAGGPFIKVNLGGISDSLFESEMFGHKRGAFTDAIADRVGRFGLAHGGTIFLDEIGDLALSSQVKLLRVLQERTYEVLGSSRTERVDVRIISATNKPLDEMVRAGTFREDLLYRINLIELPLPPLRQRPGDIPLLADHFLQTLQRSYDRPRLRLTDDAINWLRQQTFAGNIRQLKNLLERTVLLAAGPHIGAAELALHYSEGGERGNDALPAVGEMSLEEIEIRAIKKALAFHDNQVAAAARSLGLTRSSLYRRLAKYGIDHDD